MKLKLNEGNDSPKKYKKFNGKYIEQMPKLIAEGRTPLSASELMRRRLKVLTASQKVRAFWIEHYVDTGDAVAYHPDGRLKIVLDSEHLRCLNSETELAKLVDGGGCIIEAVALKNGEYEKLQGYEFTRQELKGHIEEFWTEE